MKLHPILPPDLMIHFVWFPLLILGVGLLADGAMHAFHWLVGAR